MTAEAPEKAAKEKAPEAADERSAARPGRGALVLAAIAVILALVALAGVGATGWAWYQLRGEQARVAELEGRVSALSGRVADVAAAAAPVSTVNALQARVGDLVQSSRQQGQAFEQALHGLASRITGAGTAYREDEAETLMRLAQQRLQLAGDAPGAAQALALADRALAATNEPALMPVRTDLAHEIQALKAVPRPDIDGAFAHLDALAERIENLPLAGSHIAPPPLPSSKSRPVGLSWRGLGTVLKRAFSPLIVVRHGPVARPLLPPREAYFVRENVKLALASAKVALLQRDARAYRASLERAQQWLSAWFATETPDVAAVQVSLAKLSKLDLAPKLPALGSALARLRAIRSGGAGK